MPRFVTSLRSPSLIPILILVTSGTVFTLGNRDDLITNQLEWPVIVPAQCADKRVGNLFCTTV